MHQIIKWSPLAVFSPIAMYPTNETNASTPCSYSSKALVNIDVNMATPLLLDPLSQYMLPSSEY